MSKEDQMLFTKLRLISQSPAEKELYAKLQSVEEKLSFLTSHFIMNEMAIKLLELKQGLPVAEQNEFIKQIDKIFYSKD